MKNTEELQNRLKAAEAEIAEVRRLMQEEESKPKPPSWGDFEHIEGYYVSSVSSVNKLRSNRPTPTSKNTFPTEEQGEATIAEAQLLQLRDSKFYRNGWKPDWSDDNLKFAVYLTINGFSVGSFRAFVEIWSFQDSETAERFLNDQRELLEIWAKKIRS